jgi:hypothetical protein
MKPIIYLMVRSNEYSVHFYLKSVRTDLGKFKTLQEARIAVRAVWDNTR